MIFVIIFLINFLNSNRCYIGVNAIGEEEKKEEDKEDATEEEEDEDLTFLGEPLICEDGDLNFPVCNRLIACMCMTGKNLIRYPIQYLNQIFEI